MRRGGVVLLIPLVLVFALSVPAVHVAGDAQPPAITDWGWDPKYPIDPQNVRLFATVTDVDGVSWVQATWCYVPPFLCLFEDMTDRGDGVWEVVVPTHPMAEGASLQIYAQDTGGNGNRTQYVYALFVDSIELTFSTGVFEAEPGQPVELNGTAYYEGNQSAPAEGLSVSIDVEGSPYTATIDPSGNFSVLASAPASDGTYAITAHTEDRTLVGDASATLAVFTIPRPDLTIGDVRFSPSEPTTGDTVFLAFRARNIGSESAPDVRVVVDVTKDGASVRVLDTRVTIQGGGAELPLVASWSPTAGQNVVQITIDPDDDVQELNDGNNVVDLTISVGTPQGADGTPGVLLLAAGVGIAAVAGLAVALVMRRRKSKPG